MGRLKLTLGLMVATLLLSAGSASALTVVSPPAAWGNAGVIALVGKFVGKTQYPLVVYKNRSTGVCTTVQLPRGSGTSPPLADNVRVTGAGGADIIIIARGGTVQCGAISWELASGDFNLGGFFIQAQGLDGDDFIATWYGFPNHIWGGNGNDSLISTNEKASLNGDAGNDKLRAWNPLFNGSDRWLAGGTENDCLESNNSQSQSGFVAHLYCDAGTDQVASFGSAASQAPDQCEGTTANHCVCLLVAMGCSSGSECCSGTCSNGQCTNFF